MYESIKQWVDIPITIKPFVGRAATGDKLFGDFHEELCYPQGEVSVVRNWQGVEVVSNTKLYVDGNVAVTKLDVIILEGEEHPIQAISTFYRNGKPDIKVVYI